MSTAGRSVIEIPANYLTYEEAAQALGIQVTSLKAAVYAGKLTALRVSGTNRKFISRAEVDTYHSRKGGREIVRASTPENDTSDMERLAKLKELVSASSAPTLDAIKTGVQALEQIAIAAILSSSGVPVDPKRITG